MGEKADVVWEVQILQLLHEGPLNTRPFSCCGLPHDSVNHHQEDRRREQTALADASLHVEGLSQITFMDDLTGGVFVELLDDGNKLRWEAVVVHQSPNDILVKAVKCLLKGGLPLQ